MSHEGYFYRETEGNFVFCSSAPCYIDTPTILQRSLIDVHAQQWLLYLLCVPVF